MPLNRSQKSRLAFLFFLMAVNAAVYTVLFRVEGEAKTLKVSFLDVGQGDAILIRGPGGGTVLIDGGRTSAVLREMSPLLSFYNRNIDVLVSTHPDADHAGGLSDVLERYRVEKVLRSPSESDTATFSRLRSAIAESGAEEYFGVEGAKIVFMRGGKQTAVANVLSPVLGTPRGADTNRASIVLRLEYGENEFLLTGDAPSDVEGAILARYPNIESDVLKAGHHGSRTSTSEDFLKAVSPEYVVLSVGKENQYGHPHKEVLARLAERGVRILRTDTQGTITFVSDGKTLRIETEK